MKLRYQILCMITLLLCGPLVAAEQDATDPLIKLIKNNQYSIVNNDNRFTGEGVEWLLEQAADAQFFLIGEEHGIAENPLLAAQLFTSLVPHGYKHLGIEVSPPMASHLDAILKEGGLNALKASFTWGTEPAFFGMQEEAEMLAHVRASLPKQTQAFWGLDYEVAGDKVLIEQLLSMSPPSTAMKSLENLQIASQQAWQKYLDTQGPQHIFSFSGQPELVSEVIANWPQPSAPVRTILNSLHETLRINQLWVTGNGWQSNQRRAALFRSNFLDHWQTTEDKQTKVMFKLGASHLMRGLNSNNTYDLGSLLPEVAALNNSKAFSVLVLPGQDSQVAVLDPTVWQYRAAPAKDGYSEGLGELYAAAASEGYSVIDLRALRPELNKRAHNHRKALKKLMMRFDALLLMTHSTASNQLTITE